MRTTRVAWLFERVAAAVSAQARREGREVRLSLSGEESTMDRRLAELLVDPVLQLARNAVTHGIANLPDGGQVHLAAECENGRLSIVVENTFDPEATPTHRHGMGLANVRQRLDARYPKEASMRVNTTADQFQVNLSLPAESLEGTS